jgi:hypothetical protein
MPTRYVTRSKKDRDGDILALCNQGELWSPRQKPDAIRDIESGVHSYYTNVGGKTAQVYVKNGPRGKYLTTSQDGVSRNNLDDLPDC